MPDTDAVSLRGLIEGLPLFFGIRSSRAGMDHG